MKGRREGGGHFKQKQHGSVCKDMEDVCVKTMRIAFVRVQRNWPQGLLDR